MFPQILLLKIIHTNKNLSRISKYSPLKGGKLETSKGNKNIMPNKLYLSVIKNIMLISYNI